MALFNPLNWFGGGPVPVLGEEAEELQVQQNSVLLHLPPEMRGMILGMLSRADQKNCRFVCRLMKYDIEQDIGIRARISGSENKNRTWHQHTLVEYLVKIATQEEEIRASKFRLDWLKSVRVTSLDVQRLSHFPLVIGEPFLQSPSSLRTLILRFDEYIEGRLKGIDIMDKCLCLNSFQMIYDAPKTFLESHPIPDFMFDKIEAFNSNLLQLLQQMLQSLSRTRLRRLNIFADPGPEKPLNAEDGPLPLEEYYIGMPLLTQRLQIDTPPLLQVLEINVMHFRDVRRPYQLSTLIHLWKALLDAQTQLTHLSVRIGSIYWRYFEVVLNNCQRTLKSVEIDVGNWHNPDFTPGVEPTGDLFLISTEKLEIPEDDWLDWSVLLTQDCNLESLTIRMPSRAHATANETKNFCLNFGKLKKLELHFVKLTQLNFQKVLLELPELKELTLKEWYIASDEIENFLEYKEQSDQTFRLISNALQLQRLESVKFYGQLVSGNMYSFTNRLAFRRSVINEPNYSVEWSWYYTWGGRHQFRAMMSEPTIHIKKNP